MDTHSIACWPTLVVLAVATFTDVRSRSVPDWLALPFLLAGLAVACWVDGWQGLGYSLSGLSLGALLYAVVCWTGGVGVGPLKLCAAIGAWIGPAQLFNALLVAGMAAGVMAIGWAVRRGVLGEVIANRGERIHQHPGSGPAVNLARHFPVVRRMPYVPAIALGTFLSFFSH